MQQADTSSLHWSNRQLSFQNTISLSQLPITSLLCLFLSLLQKQHFLFLYPIFSPHVSHYCFASPSHARSAPFLTLSTAVTPFTSPPTSIKCLSSSSFLSLLPPLPPPSQFSVSSEGTHHVNMRQTSVLMSITTWLNMAECVRWIALWRSFCRDRHRYEFMYGNDDSPSAALLKCKMRIKCSWWMVRKRQ